jgi:hypothetical protein
VLVRYPIRWAIETLEQKTLEQNFRQSKILPAAVLATKLTRVLATKLTSG